MTIMTRLRFIEANKASQTLAASGTLITTAVALNYGDNFVTGANDTAACKLPAGAPGKQIRVVNTVSNKQLPIFPPTGGTINGGSTNAALTMANGAGATFYAKDALTYYTIPRVPA